MQDFRRESKGDVFIFGGEFFDLGGAKRSQMVYDANHERFRSRCSGSDTHDGSLLQPAGINFRFVVDDVSGHTGRQRDFAQSLGVGAVVRADDEHKINELTELFHGILPILSSIADVIFWRRLKSRKSPTKDIHDVSCIIETERRLREIDDLFGGFHLYALGILDGADELHRRFTHRAFDFLMTRMPDEDQRIAVSGESNSFQVNLGHQGAGGINDSKTALLSLRAHLGRNPVGAEDAGGSFGNLMDIVNKNDASTTEVFNDMAIVNDLVEDINGQWEKSQCSLHDVNGPHHTGAEPSWFG